MNNNEPQQITIVEIPEEEVEISEEEKKETEKQIKKNNKEIVLIIILILILLAIGVKSFLDSQPTKVKEEKKDYTTEYKITGNGLSDFDLYFLKVNNNYNNTIYSPLSIKYALGMLEEASSGTTKSQITNIVGNYKYNKYTNNEHMSFANAMFIKNSYEKNISKDYSKNLTNKYNAEIIYDDFSSAEKPNLWIKEKTLNLIEELFQDGDLEEANFILANALGIDMEWNNLIQATCDNYTNQYIVEFNHEKYDDSIDLLCDEIYHRIVFNEELNAKSLQIGATINNYDIIKTVGEGEIRKTVEEKYKAYLESEQGINDLASGLANPDVNSYLDQYIQELKENYGVIKSSTDFSFYADEETIVFAKDLKKYDNTTLQYVAIMPKQEKLEEYIKDIDSKTINSLISKLQTIEKDNFKENTIYKINGSIPIFKYEYDLKLVKDLNKLGITDVFDKEKADLSSMTSSNSYIKDAFHKSNIEFSNEGIKASAATGTIGLGSTTGGFEYLFEVPIKQINLDFEKPYIYFIRDKESGEVWFAGSIYEPLLIEE